MVSMVGDTSFAVDSFAAIPLVVDVDGTLIFSDLFVETAFRLAGRNPLLIFVMIGILFTRGKAGLKTYLADRSDIEIAHLPYDDEVLSVIRQARTNGRCVYLASASHGNHVGAIAEHLGMFEGWFATDGETNLSGSRKRDVLVDRFGDRGFDYIGNAKIDLDIWAIANKSIGVNAPSGVKAQLKSRSPDAVFIDTRPSQFKAWIKLLRVHQWAKKRSCLRALADLTEL